MRRVRAERRLRAKDIGKLAPGQHEDGGGLRLVVGPSGARRWTLRVTVAGKRRNYGLGSWPVVSLDAARDKALDMRRAAREGRDIAATKSVSFRQAFETYWAQKRQSLSEGHHVDQWRASLETHAFPVVGDMPVGDIAHADVLRVLEPIWHTKPAQAIRVLQRMRAVFKSAIVRGQRQLANPCEGVAEELGTARRRVRHHPALPYRELPGFIRMLRTCNSSPIVKLAFEWLVLTAVRSDEARGALWSEIDEERTLWSIPAPRMKKGRREHIVPLSRRCVAILQEARALSPGGTLVFPAPYSGFELGDGTFLAVLRANKVSVTPHGFRSSFRDWVAETGAAPDPVAEAALAHVVRGVEGAYRRTTFLEERRGLMQRWADFCEPR